MTREEALHNLREARQEFIKWDKAAHINQEASRQGKRRIGGLRAFSYENWLAACRAFREVQINTEYD